MVYAKEHTLSVMLMKNDKNKNHYNKQLHLCYIATLFLTACASVFELFFGRLARCSISQHKNCYYYDMICAYTGISSGRKNCFYINMLMIYDDKTYQLKRVVC